MAKVPTYNLFYHKGDSFDDVQVVWKSEGTPVDLTGYVAKMVIATAPGAAAVVTLQSDGGSPTLVIDAPNGKVAVNAPPATMSPLVAGTEYYYDLQVSSASPVKVKTLIQGTFCVDAEVTT